ncbi:MAG: hypothetical protein A2X54_03655 [Nitrospirae bacterium GWF2_44_13]|nr:MAG: hypothetical protein A2X54_03655 [Nitrospirae bacterium GWF2_44_13]OGW32645.1 MAG: hypothetical protein A2088_03070 [Nitrospirae bacterium GWD2_44_7]OGW65500.1 MAG: hypothetical protein A2222_02450 [Nitrospirae bacterium RIFOXYA2_FULL_44_9]HBG92593.1 hypothetical protein [Nitrospiraceae bacterium]
MTRKDNFIYGGIALCSAAFLFWIIPAYTPEYPGYGVAAAVLPNVTVGFILALSVLALAMNIFSYLSAKPASPEKNLSEDSGKAAKVHLRHLVSFIVPSVLLMYAMMWIGFIPAAIAFMLVIQYLCGQRKPVTIVLVALSAAFLVYGAMRYGLGAPMP